MKGRHRALWVALGVLIAGVALLDLWPSLLVRAVTWEVRPAGYPGRRSWLDYYAVSLAAAFFCAAALAGPLGDCLLARAKGLLETPRAPLVVAAGLLVVGGLLRFLWLEADPPAAVLALSSQYNQDEGVWSYLAAEWANGRDPMGGPEYIAGALSLPYTLGCWLSFELFGFGLFQLRLPTALLGTLMAPVFWLGASRVFPNHGRAVLLWTATFLATLFLFIMHQRPGFTDAWLAAVTLASWLFWGAGQKSGRPSLLALGGALAGVVLALKPSGAAFFMGPALVFAYRARTGHFKEAVREMSIFGAGALAVLLPFAAFYVLRPEYWRAAMVVLGYNVPHTPQGPLGWAQAIFNALRFNPMYVHAPLVGVAATIAAATILVRALKGRPDLEANLFLIGCCIGTTLLLAYHNYKPPRYYMQLVAPMTILGVMALAELFKGRTRRPLLAWLAVVVLLAELGFSLVRFERWTHTLAFGQRDAGRGIGRVLAERGASGATVAGMKAFNWSPSGYFQPVGFRITGEMTLDQIVAEKTRYYVGAELSPARLARYAEGPARLTPVGKVEYLDLYLVAPVTFWVYEITYAPP